MLKSFQLLCAFWLLLFGAAFAKSTPSSHSLLHEGITLNYDANGNRTSKRENGTLVQSYLYVHGNPINGTDPSGLLTIGNFFAAQKANQDIDATLNASTPRPDAFSPGISAVNGNLALRGTIVAASLAGIVGISILSTETSSEISQLTTQLQVEENRDPTDILFLHGTNDQRWSSPFDQIGEIVENATDRSYTTKFVLSGPISQASGIQHKFNNGASAHLIHSFSAYLD